MSTLLDIRILRASISQLVPLMANRIRYLLAPMHARLSLMVVVVAIVHVVVSVECGIGHGCLGLLSG